MNSQLDATVISIVGALYHKL